MADYDHYEMGDVCEVTPENTDPFIGKIIRIMDDRYETQSLNRGINIYFKYKHKLIRKAGENVNRREVNNMDQSELGGHGGIAPAGRKRIKYLGEYTDVDADSPVVATLKGMLARSGVDSFDLIIDGNEISDSGSIPATFAGVGELEVRRYVKAG